MRVYEIARDVGMANKELIAKIRALGLEVNNHMSSLDADDVQRVKRSLERERLASTETRRLSSTVLRRRSKGTRKKVTPEATTPVDADDAKAPAQEAKPVAKPKKRKAAEPAPEAAPAPEATPVEAEEAKPAPKPKKRKKAEPAPEPEPVAATAAAAPEVVEATEAAPPIEADAAEPAKKTRSKAKAKSKAKGKVVVAGPKVVEIDGEVVGDVAPPQPVAKAKPKAAPAVKAEPKEAVPVAKENTGDTARLRFEAELARARERVAEREAEEKAKKQEVLEKEQEAREPGRPAVGSIISLPSSARIRITERAPTPSRQMPGQGQIRGRFANQYGRGRKKGRDFGRKRQPTKKGKSTQITTPADHKRVIRMEDTIAIPELAKGMGVKATEVLKKLWSMGMVGININASIDHETAQLLAGEFGYEVQNVAFKEEEVFVSVPDDAESLVERAPVVTVMGHVDHGKTSLLDAIRKARVAAGEAGGITQHVAAYRVKAGKDFGDIVFIDTPGHEAFTEMRARGAQATDIVVLVVAANDGIMPQTLEALNHAKDAGVTIIVAVNKIDLPDAQPERVRQQLAEHNLIPEEWGGDTMYVDVSALKGEGIDKLLESIALTAELAELRANPDKEAVGVIIEAKLDRNRGPMATVLVQSGTLRAGNVVVAGQYFGKVRAMLNDHGKPVKEAGPSTPVELLGLDGVPEAGETVNVADDEKTAKQVVEYRRQARRKKELATTGKISLENIMEKIQEGAAKELKIVLKADVQGSAEAVKASLLKQSTEKVKVNVIQAGVGGITESDVNLAKAGGAIVIGFHVRPAGKSAKLAEKEGVDIKLYDIIYEALDDVRAAMAGLLAPIKREVRTGEAEVRETFPIPRVGTVAGCMIKSGKVMRKSQLRVVRDSIQIFEGKVASLKRFKDDVSEVKEGYECGIMVNGFNDIKIGDIIEAYEIVEEAAKL